MEIVVDKIRIAVKTKYNLFCKNCPSGINHLNVDGIELINKVGSEDCKKCDYHLAIKNDCVYCFQNILDKE